MALPSVLTANQIGDLVATTQKNLGKGRFTQLGTKLNKYTSSNLLTRHQVKIRGGYALQWDVMLSGNNLAKNVSLFGTDDLDDSDVMTQATADWRFSESKYSLENRIMSMNGSEEEIVDLVITKQEASLISFMDLMEENLWGPPVAVTDTLTPWGINTWFTKNATQGFNSGAPSGYTTIGLNPTTVPAWQNWTDQYSSSSTDDLVRRWRKASNYTIWEKPAGTRGKDFDTGESAGYFTNYPVIAAMEDVLTSQNNNVGADIAKYDGEVMFHRRPVDWVPRLDIDTTNPVYGVPWSVMKTAILQGWWLKETTVPIYPFQHTQSAYFKDCVYQWLLYDRRKAFVIATGTSTPS